MSANNNRKRRGVGSSSTGAGRAPEPAASSLGFSDDEDILLTREARRAREADADPLGGSEGGSDAGYDSPPGLDDAEEEDGAEADVIPTGQGHQATLPMRAMMEDEDDEGEDLYADQMNNDYKEMPHLDRYDSSALDDQEQGGLDAATRAQVDALLNRRDLERARRQGRIPDMFLPDAADLDLGLVPGAFRSRRVARQFEAVTGARGAGGLASDAFEAEAVEDLRMMSVEAMAEAEASGYTLRDFVTLEHCRRRIQRDFATFLSTCTDGEGRSVYQGRMRRMAGRNGASLVVSYAHLSAFSPFLARLLANVPRETLALFDAAAKQLVLAQFPHYERIVPEVCRVRIVGLPAQDTLRDLRHQHLGTLVRVQGVVTRRSEVFPQLQLVKYDCLKCGAVLGPFTMDGSTNTTGTGGGAAQPTSSNVTMFQGELKIGACSHCMGKGPFSLNAAETVYRNYQKLTLQESPGSVPAGRLPRHKEVILVGDLIDLARPGDAVDVTGIYCHAYSFPLNAKQGFPVFSTLIEANAVLPCGTSPDVEQLEDGAHKRGAASLGLDISEEEERSLRALAQDPRLKARLLKSIAPSIYGHEDVKLALALSMFGGQPKTVPGSSVALRGDIHVLMLGDPGTAKSQFLKYVAATAPRSIYTTGQGASAVGLTASVRKDPERGEWTLEGGALVLADRGHCLIDEFDKMTDLDRTSLHEAMEQQSISISKAGIVTVLRARAAVIAAANPVRGRYNPALPFGQNVQLGDPILSRFDVLCVVRDIPDPIDDARLAAFVVGSHQASHPSAQTGPGTGTTAAPRSNSDDDVEPLDQETLRKYIAYARAKVFPVLGGSGNGQGLSPALDKLTTLYADLRQASLRHAGGLAITVRHMESLVRMAEAHARLHLRDRVLPLDLDQATAIMLRSFISAQKFSVAKRLQKAFSKYIVKTSDHTQMLLFLLHEEAKERLKYLQFKQGGSSASLETLLSAPIRLDLDAFERKAVHVLQGAGPQDEDAGAVDQRPDLASFYASSAFARDGFALDRAQRAIVLHPQTVL